MVGAAVSANPLKLDVRSHAKCIVICVIATLSTFQYAYNASAPLGRVRLERLVYEVEYTLPYR
ncbi:hypothetical protein LTR47_000001 [Exophiala xenobiotica]|nr:hypothetical protein LTR47_000001 [Exophiala xenobiotica]KAK5239811.1 hypothetical protein LTS06_012665 [Exophiala xenobiotica]KAK5275571.1 hypothetical protein LTR40_012822 [Exophiala xenobiotica]KAK5325824.1 hypothetical protein LTR93_004045 [Exophiala xenobiotica]KAK5350013.1 hypothetical protein LTR61_006720 [Exophiala xenobiotica]